MGHVGESRRRGVGRGLVRLPLSAGLCALQTGDHSGCVVRDRVVRNHNARRSQGSTRWMARGMANVWFENRRRRCSNCSIILPRAMSNASDPKAVEALAAVIELAKALMLVAA